MCHGDLKLETVYAFTLEDVVEFYGETHKEQELERILDRWSFQFGDLKEQNREHIILDNPIHQRPFIKVDDRCYYTAVVGLLGDIALRLLENCIAEDADWWEEYCGVIKPQYLEEQVREVFVKQFPSAAVHRGSMWKDPESGTEYENDLAVVIDNFVIVIEAKSGLMTRPARRGAPDRLFETLRRLIEEPGLQANRFIKYLKSARRVHRFYTRSGGTNVIDSSAIEYYIPLGVTMEEFGTVGSNLKELIEAGVVTKKLHELAPSMSLTALQIVMETLESEAERVHYLVRRRELESHVKYMADEIDLLAFYLDNGFNIGEAEFSGSTSFLLTMKSKELDPYFVGRVEGVKVDKPRLSMTKWWRDLLVALSMRKPEKWLEACFTLLCTTKEDQSQFELQLEGLKKRIRRKRGVQKHNWIGFASGPPQRRFFIAGYPYETNDRKLRNGVIHDILASDAAQAARGALCIGVHLERAEYPYNVLAGRKNNRLFLDLEKYE